MPETDVQYVFFPSQHCDNVIMKDYPGMSDKGGGKVQVYAQIVGEVVEMLPSKEGNSFVSFDPKPAQVGAFLVRSCGLG